MMTAVVRGDALHLPLADESVDAIITSPPYFSQRSYRDDGEHYEGQIGSEPDPQQFLEALWAASTECFRVLKPSGSCFVNLGDKRSGSGGHNNSGVYRDNNSRHRWDTLETSYGIPRPSRERRAAEQNSAPVATRRNAPDRYNQAAFGRPKSKMLLPHRYAAGCEDGLADPDGVGWIVRQDMVWSKPNGLPESVTDRVRDSHEYWFHLVKQGDYFSAIDEIRETSAPPSSTALNGPTAGFKSNTDRGDLGMGNFVPNPLGKLPGSVWAVPSEPLGVPPWFIEDETGWRFFGKPGAPSSKDNPRGRILRRQFACHLWELRREGRHPRIGHLDHFAAFPQEWPRRLILGWTPFGICTVCGEGRRPVVAKMPMVVRPSARRLEAQANGQASRTAIGGTVEQEASATITGYACACTPWRDHPGTGGPGFQTSGQHRVGPTGKQHVPENYPERTGPWREYLTVGWTPPPTRPAVVLDPFGGTGTVAMVARALGRTGISLDLSADYSRLARWRVFQSGHAAKTRQRTNRDRQGTML